MNKSRKVLVIEDSSEAYHLVHRALSGVCDLKWASSARQAETFIADSVFDLILLDVNLPDGDGMHLCSLFKTDPRFDAIPVILLTARQSSSDKILAFNLGAEDFVTKPFEPLELRARVEARLRRRAERERRSDITLAGPIEIDKRTQIAQINENGQSRTLDLTPIEFKILLMLAREPNVVHNRDKILNTVWGENIHVYSRSVDTHVSKLRRKLGVFGDMIGSVHGVGYRLVVEATPNAALEVGQRLGRVPNDVVA